MISGMRVELISNWPAGGNFTGDNVTHSDRFLGRVSSKHLESPFLFECYITNIGLMTFYTQQVCHLLLYSTY